MKSHNQVLKFGGTSVGNGERIRRVAQIIASTFHDPAEAFPIVVVSAMSKVTDQLLSIATLACTGELETYQHELKSFKQKHLDAADKAVHDIEKRNTLLCQLEQAFILLEEDIAALRLAAQSLSSQRSSVEAVDKIPLATAAVAAWGERLSVLLVAASVSDIGLPAAPVREEVIITGHPVPPGNAQIY